MGMLTGIRPTKIIMKWMEEEKDSAKLEQRFRETYLADPQKRTFAAEWRRGKKYY